ncbi:MAG: YjgN family protein [Pseudomonadota bacterium]|nr:YjgN family protein [Pseudomonadota bacterium]MEC8836891.1 YjgN family protein [Pseudomonadota bacterium]
MNGSHQNEDADSAFAFEGNWQDFARIALPNLLLTIVTLGVYRFWATTRERRYLWSRTRFVDENLEWAGTGMELFIGFVMVFVLFGIPYFGLSFVAQALVARGYESLGIALSAVAALAIFYLLGVARFRALRYRLSRTRWRGIRGGSNSNGFLFGLSYMWKTALGWLPLGLLLPWSMTSLWNERWNQMSFGPFAFEADARSGNVFARFLLFYLSPLVFFIGGMVMAAMGMLAGYGIGGEGGAQIGGIIGMAGLILFFYLGLGLIAVAFYAKYYREVVGATRWRDLGFHFEASSLDWVKLLLGDALLVVLTFGIGFVFLSYRHWKFFVTHLDAHGEILLDELTQSQTRTARHGEGLLDAFDMGAI